MTYAKICGLRDPASLRVAAEAGADFVGVVFVPGVRRRVSLEHAQEMLEGFRQGPQDVRPRVVGLFADQPLEEVNRVAEACGLDQVQLCGQEPIEYCQQTIVPAIKVVHVRDTEVASQEAERILREVEVYTQAGALITLDRQASATPGGAGRPFDWAIAERVALHFPFLLAGGLTPDNVSDAIQHVHPWGVDVSSGVETGGIKDGQKVRAFLEAVRRSDAAVPR